MRCMLENAGRHAGWEVWVLVRQRIESRSARGIHAVTGCRDPLAILLIRPGRVLAFPLIADLEDPERLAAQIRMAR